MGTMASNYMRKPTNQAINPESRAHFDKPEETLAERFSKWQLRGDQSTANSRLNVKTGDYQKQKTKRDRAMIYWKSTLLQENLPLPPIDGGRLSAGEKLVPKTKFHEVAAAAVKVKDGKRSSMAEEDEYDEESYETINDE